MGTYRQTNDVTERSGEDADAEHRREGGVDPRRKNHPALGEMKQGEKIIKLTRKSFRTLWSKKSSAGRAAAFRSPARMRGARKSLARICVLHKPRTM